MMMLDPKEVGRQRCDDALVSSISLLRTLGRDDEVVHVAIAELEFVRSFLSTITPAEVGGLVERLRVDERRASDVFSVTVPLKELRHEAATALEALAAELASSEIHRNDLYDTIVNLRTDLTAERAAHAETKRERDEAKRRLFPYADATEICGYSTTGIYLIGDRKSVDAAKKAFHYSAQIDEYRTAFNERVKATKAQRDEALKALEPFAEASRRFDEATERFGVPLTPDHRKPRTEFTHGHLRAARRGREGGKADG